MKARATCSARSRDQDPTRDAIASPAAIADGDERSGTRRASITACRSRSTSASRSGPPDALITSPEDIAEEPDITAH